MEPAMVFEDPETESPMGESPHGGSETFPLYVETRHVWMLSTCNQHGGNANCILKSSDGTLSPFKWVL